MSNITIKMIDNIVDKINESNNIYICSHVQPDGDNIGSMLALGLSLKVLGKNASILKADSVPVDYQFLPGIEMIKDYEIIDNLDLFIVVDCSDEDRLGKNKKFLKEAKFTINIDHHISNTYFGDINMVDSKASATGELIYSIVSKLDIKLGKDIATNIYTAISTDTGSFMYESVTDKTHEIAAKLLRCGIDKDYINIKLYHSRSMERTNLFIKSFSTLKTYKDNKIAVVKVTQEMLQSTNTKLEDTEGIISFVRDIEGVEVACLLKEFGDKETKVSLRSKKDIDVSKISQAFNGGGHIRAAGCTIYENINDSAELIVEKIMDEFR